MYRLVFNNASHKLCRAKLFTEKIFYCVIYFFLINYNQKGQEGQIQMLAHKYCIEYGYGCLILNMISEMTDASNKI